MRTDAGESTPSISPGRRGLVRVAVTVTLAVTVMVGALLVVGVLVVRGRVLDPGTYTSALVDNDAYERVYTEVLADPELAETKEELLGRLRLPAFVATQVRALSVAAVRWVLPPTLLQEATEAALTDVLGYVRGDQDELAIAVRVDGAVDRIDDVAVREVRTVLAGAAASGAESLADYRLAVEAFVADLASGTVPSVIPTIDTTGVDRTAVAATIVGALGPAATPELTATIEALVLGGNERDALVTAAGELVRPHAAGVAAGVQDTLARGTELDVVGALSERSGRTRQQIAATLDHVRGLAAWFGPLTAVLGVLLMVAGTAGLVFLHRSDGRTAALLVGGSWIASGILVLVMWVLAVRVVGSPLEPATTTGPGSWNLPAGLRALLADLEQSIAGELRRPVVVLATVLVVAGLVVVLAGAAWRLVRWPSARVALAATVSVVLVTAGGVVLVGLVQADEDTTRACNGHPELCERPYDEVVYGATHNSMSSPDVVQVWPEHDGDIRAQLDDGVRALLIDTHYWDPLVSPDQLTSVEPLLSGPVASTLVATVGPRAQGREGTFLCHIHCAFGAVPFVDALASVRSFLEDAPDEVVTLIVQDAISPDDTAVAFRDAGLEPYLYTPRPGEAWPTLDELIDRGERLVVFAEEAGPPPDWYLNAFEHMQETPYLFLSQERFTCAPNRGDPDASLFLMNHWIQRVAADRVDAAVVNAHDVLVGRARECEAERGQLPNFLAVNFSDIGDLREAVDTLNGV